MVFVIKIVQCFFEYILIDEKAMVMNLAMEHSPLLSNNTLHLHCRWLWIWWTIYWWIFFSLNFQQIWCMTTIVISPMNHICQSTDFLAMHFRSIFDRSPVARSDFVNLNWGRWILCWLWDDGEYYRLCWNFDHFRCVFWTVYDERNGHSCDSMNGPLDCSKCALHSKSKSPTIDWLKWLVCRAHSMDPCAIAKNVWIQHILYAIRVFPTFSRHSMWHHTDWWYHFQSQLQATIFPPQLN